MDNIHAHQQKSKARAVLPILIIGVILLAVIGYFVSRHRRAEETVKPATIQQTTTPTNQNTQTTTTPAAVPMQTPDAGMPVQPITR